jgi:hypothetical protein
LGNIFIITEQDTISVGNKDCRVEGRVLNSDSTNFYVFAFLFTSPKTFFMTSKNKIQIRFSDGEVYEDNIYTDGEFIGKERELKIKIQVSKYILTQMKDQSVASIVFITSSFKHVIPLTDLYQNKLMSLSAFLLDIDVYNDNFINWSELTSQPFPVN